MLSSKWFVTFTGDAVQKTKLEETIRGSSYVLNLLSDHIEREIKKLEAIKTDEYDKPHWELRVADRNGQLKAMRNLLSMTKLEKDVHV